MGKAKYLCPCFKVTKKDVKKAIKEGACSYKEVKKATGASSGCGHCKCKVKRYVKKRQKKDQIDALHTDKNPLDAIQKKKRKGGG